MKKIFVSDFDGTLTKRDFYRIMIDDYLGQAGKTYFEDWVKSGGKIDIDFLNKIFSWIEVDESRYQALIEKVEIDQYLKAFRAFLEKEDTDLLILSAGFDLYIHDALKRMQLGDIRVITNPGVHEDNRLAMVPDQSKDYYSPLFGIDKGKVVESLREDYDIIYFAGDSEPDLYAAKHADVVFAKELLADLMDKEGLKYYPYENFVDIHNHLKDGDFYDEQQA